MVQVCWSMKKFDCLEKKVRGVGKKMLKKSTKSVKKIFSLLTKKQIFIQKNC